MDTTVAGIASEVVARLRSAGYMESTIGQYEKSIKALTAFLAERGGVYTPELGAEFAALTVSPRTGRFSAQRRFDYTRLVALFDSYVATGRVDLSMRKRGGGGAVPVTDEFVELVDVWESEMTRRGLAPATREAYRRMACSYLVFLESTGAQSLVEVNGASVLEFLESLTDRWSRSSLFWVVSNLRPFLRFTERVDLVEGLRIAGIKRSHRIVPVLSEADEVKVLQVCAAGQVSARDAAITLLALTTGLRSCDLVALRLGDIDWRSQTASLVQQKTHNRLTVPLMGAVVDKLATYILTERPDSSDDHVFLRCKAPRTCLSDHAAIHRITAAVFARAGVTEFKGGTTLLRHNAASRLLRASVPLPTISAVLGHASADSTNTYLSVDRDRLLGCVLDVPAPAVRS
ncbi:MULTISPECIES: tyrosine-type recombinase/integrase [unclassified Gordonia (in: high G+C Gram-positive bacteria)]|uniref:tyrosine-type recombinase/integrase n=1 Tax=Gordonia TaxID=2053 RepID=UPI001F10BABB|nr:tyrosine-type recombinase/integrase [Gordonia sp. ABSL49_1]MCH5645491.1 site-specific integrase [Gordonia sp. ABSL49_1]